MPLVVHALKSYHLFSTTFPLSLTSVIFCRISCSKPQDIPPDHKILLPFVPNNYHKPLVKKTYPIMYHQLVVVILGAAPCGSGEICRLLLWHHLDPLVSFPVPWAGHFWPEDIAPTLCDVAQTP